MAQPGPSSLILSAAAITLAVIGGGDVRATTARPSPAKTAADCQALVRDFPDIPDAPTRVAAASVTEATRALPAFCGVKATIRPRIGMELRLPTRGWNGKFFQLGRGGNCRPVSMQECDTPLRKGYACVITDQGNQTGLPDDEWSHDDVQAKADCAFRGVHLATVAGKALTAAFYGEAPRLSYFMGCSSGGRYGLVEAQRFPHDFDGIISGAPPVSKSGSSLNLAWAVVSTLGPDGRSILGPADIDLLSKAVIARCDLTDGVLDGIVGDPLACRFDPAELQCASSKDGGCLTPAQVSAVRRIYQGPVDSTGRRLHPGGAALGSEAGWLGSYVAPDSGVSSVRASMNTMFRFMNYPARPAGWDISRLDWDRDPPLAELAEAYNGAFNPDLRAFKAAGGKLIIYEGLADQAITPASVIDYYQAIQRTMGGPAATAEFARLFLVPGMAHCGGGPGPGVIDYIAALEGWVEQGRAPDSLLASRLKPAATGAAGPVVFPLAPQDVTFTRPVYAYPLTARYKGVGPVTDAASFQPAPSGAVQ